MKKPAIKDRRSENILRTASAGRRSKLYRWLVENHDTFKATLAAAGQPDWKALSEAFGKAGLTDRLGKAPTPEGARQTWFAVRQAVAKSPVSPSRPAPVTGERQAAPRQSSPLPSSAPGHPVGPDTGDDDDPPPRPLKHSRIR